MGIINRIVYYGFVIPLSLLPFWALYGLSDVLCVLMYHVVGYRKKVVFTNLRNSFPNMSEKERLKLAKNFYRHFCDVTLESLKLFTISDKEARERMVYFDHHVVQKYFEQGRSLIVAMAHYHNWELVAVTVDQQMQHQAYAIYKPLTSPYFDKKMLVSREKYGLKMIRNNEVKQDFEKMKNDLTATFFVIDQSPSFHSKPHWMTFLNQETGVLMGTEKYSKDYNYPVVYLDVQRVKRGYYTCRFVDVESDPRSTKEGEITEKVTRLLESYIIKKPDFWLWTHKRWKRKKDEQKVHLER
jgi:Kdo2-lipid IVA lauroyltransferase/acyltransferase